MMHGMRRRKAAMTMRRAGLLVLMLGLGGCVSADQSVVLATQAVSAITVGDASAVSADELATAMLQAGFSDESILRYGPDVHEALATSGGAQIREGKVVEALFAIHGNQLYVTSRTRGTFVVPIAGSVGGTAALAVKG
jgi:hypothetical protein